jgi:hypothetical protein
MATQKQIDANRRNARKSTGPRTPEGRATSSQNALRHGLTAEQIIVRGESKEEFLAFYRDLYEALNPTDPVAECLVERIITGEWRLRRMQRAEAGLADAVGGAENVFHGLFKEMASLSRYETALDRGLQRARHELERYQARCRGEPVTAPIAVTVSGTVDVENELRSSRGSWGGSRSGCCCPNDDFAAQCRCHARREHYDVPFAQIVDRQMRAGASGQFPSDIAQRPHALPLAMATYARQRPSSENEWW